MLRKKFTRKLVFYAYIITAESISTKFCTSTHWANVSPSTLVKGFWGGGGAKFGHSQWLWHWHLTLRIALPRIRVILQLRRNMAITKRSPPHKQFLSSNMQFSIGRGCVAFCGPGTGNRKLKWVDVNVVA